MAKKFYSPDYVRSSLRHMISALGLWCLEEPPTGTTVAPPGTILVALDFENTRGLQNGPEEDINAQMGVAILDPLHLQHRSLSSSSCQLIQTFQFASGCPEYLKRASHKFVFGETVICRPCDFITSFSSLLPPDRPFILIAQNVSNERTVLRHFGYDLDRQPQFSGIVDTYPMSGDVFHAQRCFGSLKRILMELKIEWNEGGLHCAGNDAHFTLRAALLLAERGYLEQCPSPTPGDAVILAAIRESARARVPQRERFVQSPQNFQKVQEVRGAREKVIQRRTAFREELARLEAEMEDLGYACMEQYWPFQ